MGTKSTTMRIAKKSSGIPRFRFVQDDSCHWYAIPSDKRQEFDLWVESFNCEGDTYKEFIGEDFEQYRIDGGPSHYTFTELKEDR